MKKLKHNETGIIYEVEDSAIAGDLYEELFDAPELSDAPEGSAPSTDADAPNEDAAANPPKKRKSQ